MPTTSNFGWTTPADTDLVKDGAAAIRTLGNGIDTSFLDLKGGTTDQVLAKNSNTDLDFKWVAQDDSNAIQNAIIDAKGDLIVGTAADTPARLAVGTDGQVLTADSVSSGGVKWASVAGGGKTLLSTTSLSGSSVLVSDISQDYIDLFIVCQNVNWNTSNSSFQLLLNDGSSNTQCGNRQIDGSFTRVGINNPLETGTIYRTGLNTMVWYLTRYTASDDRPYQGWGSVTTTAGDGTGFSAQGSYKSNVGAVTSIRFTNAATNSGMTGTIYIYGVK